MRLMSVRELFSFSEAPSVGPISIWMFLASYTSTRVAATRQKSDGWMESNDECSWHGITCGEDGDSKGRVMRNVLGENNLVGTIWNSYCSSDDMDPDDDAGIECSDFTRAAGLQRDSCNGQMAHCSNQAN